MLRCLALLFATMAVLMVGHLHAATPVPASVRVRIGFMGPLSGLHAASGQDALNGARLAVERLNLQHFLVGGLPTRFELLVRDDQADPARGAAVADEFVRSHVSAVLGPFNSSVALAAAPVFEHGRLPMLTVASSPALMRAGPGFAFRIAASDRDMGRKLAQYAAQSLHVRRVGIIQDGSDYAAGLLGEFIRQVRQEGVEAVVPIALGERATDVQVRAALTQLHAFMPDALFFAGYVPEAAQILREMHHAGIALPMLAGDAQCSSEMSRLAGDYLQHGVYCVQGGVWLTRAADGAVFASAYQHRYGRSPDVYAASFYDGLMLVAHAMRRAGSARPELFVETLARGRYKGTTALYEFDAAHELKESAVTILRWKDGVAMPLASF